MRYARRFRPEDGMYRSATTMLAVLAMAAAPKLAHAEASVAAELAVTTDYLFRGVSQTMSGPAVQAGLSVDTDPGFYTYVWASNVDFTASGDPDDGAKIEIDAGVGYWHSISERVDVELEWADLPIPRHGSRR